MYYYQFNEKLIINPNISLETQINGAFDYNCTPLAPTGTKAIIHKKPGDIVTWDLQGTKVWYIGGTPEHYRCWTIYVTKMEAEGVSDTVDFYPQQFQLVTLSPNSLSIKSATEITNALKNPLMASPFPSPGI